MCTAWYSRWVLMVRVRRLSWRVTAIPLRHFITRKQTWLVFIPFCLPAFARCCLHQHAQLFLLHRLMCKLSSASSVPSFRRWIFGHLVSSHTADKCSVIFPLLSFPLLSFPLLSCPLHVQCHHLYVPESNCLNCTVVPTVLYIRMYMHADWSKFT